jgi:Ca2+-binding EF-hand superfamily protein
MLPNISEDQVLIKYFKYFDLENSGRATLREFIKTMDKVGVVLGKVHDIETIFNYYDKENLGSLDYKKFISELFSRLKRKEERIDCNYKKNDKTENNRYITNNFKTKRVNFR